VRILGGTEQADSVSDSALFDHDRGRGVRLIAGADEVGAGGCWAGPIMAAGVLFDLELLASGAGRELLKEVNDSKRIKSAAKRERLAKAVFAHAEAVSVVSIRASHIDRIGLRPANLTCLDQALRDVGESADLRLVDGYELGANALVHERIVHGDRTSATIAAASIVAKVARDRLMACLGERYPGYGFERHKGYGRPEHVAAIVKFGPTPEHRLSNKAVARCIAEWRANGGGS
jgi:ribonuclease HII